MSIGFLACSMGSHASNQSKTSQLASPKSATHEQLLRSQEQVNAAKDNYSVVKDYSRGLGFGKETNLDQELEGNEFIINDISLERKLQAQTSIATHDSDHAKLTKSYTLQFATIGNFDAAQSRKYELAEKYGLSLYLKFDPPFYKLQGGHYSDKQKAEDRAADLRDAGISAFVVKIK